MYNVNDYEYVLGGGGHVHLHVYNTSTVHFHCQWGELTDFHQRFCIIVYVCMHVCVYVCNTLCMLACEGGGGNVDLYTRLTEQIY